MVVDERGDRILPISGSPPVNRGLSIIVKMSETHLKIYSFMGGGR